MCLEKRKETFRVTTVDTVLITGGQLIRLRKYATRAHISHNAHIESMGKKANDLQHQLSHV